MNLRNLRYGLILLVALSFLQAKTRDRNFLVDLLKQYLAALLLAGTIVTLYLHRVPVLTE